MKQLQEISVLVLRIIAWAFVMFESAIQILKFDLEGVAFGELIYLLVYSAWMSVCVAEPESWLAGLLFFTCTKQPCTALIHSCHFVTRSLISTTLLSSSGSATEESVSCHFSLSITFDCVQVSILPVVLGLLYMQFI